jgi:hypothetical protein
MKRQYGLGHSRPDRSEMDSPTCYRYYLVFVKIELINVGWRE